MNFISHAPNHHTKCIASYNLFHETKGITFLNNPYSFDVTNRFSNWEDLNNIIVGVWKPIKIGFGIDDLKFLHINIFTDEKHYMFSDGLFLYWFITDISNKLIRIQGTEKSDYEVWEVDQNLFTPERVRIHNNNVKILNSEKFKPFREEIIRKVLV